MSAHALSIECPRADQMAAAIALARAHLCPDGGCGTCDICHWIETGNHPDLLFVQRRAKSGEKALEATIRIEQIRALLLELSRKPYVGDRRFVAILEADTMPAATQNALLKALEEPWPGCQMVLLTQNRQRLLPTILSRCGRGTMPSLAATTRDDKKEQMAQTDARESMRFCFAGDYSKMEERLIASDAETPMLLDALLAEVGEALAKRVAHPSVAHSLDEYDLARIIMGLTQCMRMTQVNVNKRQLYGYLISGIREEQYEDGRWGHVQKDQ